MMIENVQTHHVAVSPHSINLLNQAAAPGVELCAPLSQTSWASPWVIQLMFSSLQIGCFNRLLMRGRPVLYSEVIIGIVARMHSEAVLITLDLVH